MGKQEVTMFIITKRLTRRKAVSAVVLLGVLLVAAVLLAGRAAQQDTTPSDISAQSNDERLAYLRSLGWSVESEPLETLYLQLPQELAGSDYESYNTMQLTQGFDLTPFLGQQVVRYTYTVTNYPARSDTVQLNLYCCEGVVIAGDVIAPGENGFQSPLTYPAAS